MLVPCRVQAATLCVKRHPNLRARLFLGGVLEDRPFHDYPQPIHVPLVTDRTALRVAGRQGYL